MAEDWKGSERRGERGLQRILHFRGLWGAHGGPALPPSVFLRTILINNISFFNFENF